MGLFDKDVYGQAALTKALEGMDFPVSKGELIEKVGDEDIQWFKDAEPIKLREIVGKLTTEVFQTPNDLVEAVSKEIEIV